jgi:hypothetical protein
MAVSQHRRPLAAERGHAAHRGVLRRHAPLGVYLPNLVIARGLGHHALRQREPDATAWAGHAGVVAWLEDGSAWWVAIGHRVLAACL